MRRASARTRGSKGDPVAVGIDAGGTTTRLAAARGPRIVRVRGATGNFLTLGEERFAALLRSCARAVAAKTGSATGRVGAVCLGGAGLGRPRERAAAEQICAAIWPNARIEVTTDAALFLHAVFGERPGVVVVAGTGALALGRLADGSLVRAGGWGALLGDPGSSFALGRAALRLALMVRDGVRRPTELAEAVRRHLDVPDPLMAVSHVATGGPAWVAGLAPLVLRRARRGDRDARAIVERESGRLAELAVAVVRRGRLDRVALGGGLFRSRLYGCAVRRAIERAAPGTRVSVSRREPVLGALARARHLLGESRG